jgi:hypothetical protein
LVYLADKFHSGEPKNPELRENLEELIIPQTQTVLRGGARGLEILSLVECRKITDQGLAYLRKLRNLKELNLLGCYSITDAGIETIARNCLYLTSINLSGTYITRQGLEHLKRNCKFLETVVLNGC